MPAELEVQSRKTFETTDLSKAASRRRDGWEQCEQSRIDGEPKWYILQRLFVNNNTVFCAYDLCPWTCIRT